MLGGAGPSARGPPACWPRPWSPSGPGTKGLKAVPAHPRRLQPGDGGGRTATPFGDPRLDEDDIDSSGMVIRRVSGSGREAWVKRGGKVAGWVSLSRRGPGPRPGAGAAGTGRTPRARPRCGGAAAGPDGGRLHRPRRRWSRCSSPPPKDCKAAGRTLLYGVVMTASAEGPRTPTLGGGARRASARTRCRAFHLPPYFAAGKAVDWRRACRCSPFSLRGPQGTPRSTRVVRHKLSLLADFLRGAGGGVRRLPDPQAAGRASTRWRLDLGGPTPRHKAGERPVADRRRAGAGAKAGKVKLPQVPGPKVVQQGPGRHRGPGARTAATARPLAARLPPSGGSTGRTSVYVARAFRPGESATTAARRRSSGARRARPFTIRRLAREGGCGRRSTSTCPRWSDLKEPHAQRDLPRLPGKPLQHAEPGPGLDAQGRGQLGGGRGSRGCAASTSRSSRWSRSWSSNIFLSLFNIIFFWIALVKICIPIPASPEGRGSEGERRP